MALASATSISDSAFVLSVFFSLPRALTSALIFLYGVSSILLAMIGEFTPRFPSDVFLELCFVDYRLLSSFVLRKSLYRSFGDGRVQRSTNPILGTKSSLIWRNLSLQRQLLYDEETVLNFARTYVLRFLVIILKIQIG